jgi:WD40 repeat protein
LVAELKGHTHTITRAEFSQDETRVLTASDDHTARVWDAASGKEVHKFDLGAKIESIAVSPDGKTILTSSARGQNSYVKTAERQRPGTQPPAPQAVVKLWDAMTGKELLNLAHPPVAPDPHHGSHRDVRASFNKAGDQILTERQGQINYWDTATGKRLATLREPFVPSPTVINPTTVIFSPQGDFFVVLKRDQTAELWNVAERKQVREMEAPFFLNVFSTDHSRFFSPDGKTFYSLLSGHMRQKGEFQWWSLDGLK